ncbi:MAG: 4-(cytidine 5'-diphospho)-2-C-methyl-D-erythritol kinase [Mariprofundaceae bacterium]
MTLNFHPFSLLAPAKINLHLKVTGLLADGRHTLDTSFSYIDVYDELYFKPHQDLIVECSQPSLSGPKNLVYQVLQGIRKKHHLNHGLQVYIDKKLPSEAGLGGGSSDAATALIAANQVWQLQLSTQQLIDFSAPYGADIPCFLFARRSLAKGIGEKLSVFPEKLPTGYICLAKPKLGLSTSLVFKHFDSQRSLTKANTDDSVRAASQAKLAIGVNDLESSAIVLLPEINSLLKLMRQQANLAWMSGSGSTCVALCSSLNQANLLALSLQTSGLADWTHVGQWLDAHPSSTINIGA